MLAIRLARTGKKHQAYFRVVVSDSRRVPTAKFVEILGSYDPHAKKIQIKKDRVEYYLKNGAQPSNSVAKLLKRENIDLPKWVKISEKNRAPKKAAEDKAEAPKEEEVKETESEETEVKTEEKTEEKASNPEESEAPIGNEEAESPDKVEPEKAEDTK